ncbi:hypothetical protein BIY29_06155 [Brenneria alni]|uniref:O-antigen polymerase n=1 Tax=Brenneria alni TaxID=71656 RepID=A0A421DQW7_9GAMM|nr:hypothetical protein [Brenneria alni]RLM26397.1 hypothetical protein BIY29_06155 [Brenneria alni]
MYKKFVLLVFIYALFGFKLSLSGSIDGSDSGGVLSSIRIDDVLLLVFILCYFFKKNKLIAVFKKKPIFIFLLYISFCIFSTIYNYIGNNIELLSGVLFSIRPFEYLLYVFVGYEIARYGYSFKKILTVYVYYCIALVLAQMNGLIGGLTSFSFDRAIANTGGPWELAAVSAFLSCYFFENRYVVRSALSFFILILTQSRITLAGTLLVFLAGNFKKTISLLKNKYVFVSFLGAILLANMYVLYLTTGYSNATFKIPEVYNRIESFFDASTLNKIKDIYSTGKVAENKDVYFDYTYGDGLNEIMMNDGDLSAYIRFTRWAMLIKTTCNSLDSFIFGLGASFAGKAVDGNYTRLFAENGFVGLILYCFFLITFLRETKDKIIRNYLYILMITALFIDIFVTQKAMLLLWIYYGVYLKEKDDNSHREEYRDKI